MQDPFLLEIKHNVPLFSKLSEQVIFHSAVKLYFKKCCNKYPFHFYSYNTRNSPTLEDPCG